MEHGAFSQQWRFHDGVLVLAGYGLRVSMERGHLLIEDGIGAERRRLRFSRVDRELKRVVIVGHSGLITFDAVRWLHGVGVPLVHLDTDGRVLIAAAPSSAIEPTLRRSQALAAETGVGVRLSQELIAMKVDGQRRVLEQIPGSARAQAVIQGIQRRLVAATTFQGVRQLEAIAARTYWCAWQAVPVRFKSPDARQVPRHWRAFGNRASALAGSRSPRKAVNPANAILEAETRVAVLSAGLDPVLGLLHADERCRDSMVFDVMEPIRPVVDQFVLDFLARRALSRKDVFELLDGRCRLLPPLTEELAATAPLWARQALPEAQRLADKLFAAERKQTAKAKQARSMGGQGQRPRRSRRIVVREYGRANDSKVRRAARPSNRK